MILELIAHIVIPLVAGILVIVLVAAAERDPISWANCNDIGIDLAILSIGANGGIFVNPTLVQHWGAAAPVYGILVVLGDLIFAAILVYRKRWRDPAQVSWETGMTDLFLGALSVVITSEMFYRGLVGGHNA